MPIGGSYTTGVVLDLVFLLLTVAVFAALVALVGLCDHIVGAAEGGTAEPRIPAEVSHDLR